MGVSTPLLNSFQRRLAGTAITVACVTIVLLGLYGVFSLLRAFVDTFRDVLLPLALAAILATLLRPSVSLLEEKYHIPRGRSVALVLLVILAAILGVFIFVSPWIIISIGELIAVVENVWGQLRDWFIAEYPDLSQRVEVWSGSSEARGMAKEALALGTGVLQAVLGALSDVGGSFARFLGSTAMWLVTPIYLAILLYTQPRQFDLLRREISFIPKKYRDDLIYLGKQFADILFAFFRGQFTIAFLTGIILAIGFSLIGMKAGLLVGFVAGMANLIPYLGTSAGVLTLLPYAYFQQDGGLGLLIMTIIVFGGTQLFQDYVLTPRIMGQRTGLGPMTIIFGIFFWGVALDGILGVLLAIPLTAFFIVFWRLAKERYLPDFSKEQEVRASPTPAPSP